MRKFKSIAYRILHVTQEMESTKILRAVYSSNPNLVSQSEWLFVRFCKFWDFLLNYVISFRLEL